MQIDCQEFLALAEKAGSVAMLDIETTGREADYDSVVVVSVKPWHKEPTSFVVEQIGNDRRVVREALDRLATFSVWVSYYGKAPGFDIPFLTTRAVKWNLPVPSLKLHLDMYWQVRKLLTGRRSQAHILEWLETKHKKLTVSPDMWASLPYMRENLGTLRKRCESDCAGLENLYDRLKHLAANITR